MDEYHSWDIGSVLHKHRPEIMYVGQWPIFHGLLILPYICKTLAILNFANSDLLKFDMKMFVNIARLDKCQLLTQSTRLRRQCTLDTFLVFSHLVGPCEQFGTHEKWSWWDVR